MEKNRERLVGSFPSSPRGGWFHSRRFSAKIALVLDWLKIDKGIA
jgi:hypothetical protein